VDLHQGKWSVSRNWYTGHENMMATLSRISSVEATCGMGTEMAERHRQQYSPMLGQLLSGVSASLVFDPEL
jgi:hypothetical protein